MSSEDGFSLICAALRYQEPERRYRNREYLKLYCEVLNTTILTCRLIVKER